jgi:heme O synthase-like polyprenyltransferase
MRFRLPLERVRYFRGAAPAVKVLGILGVLFPLVGLLLSPMQVVLVFSGREVVSGDWQFYVPLVPVGVGFMLLAAFLWIAPHFQRGEHATQVHMDFNSALIPPLVLLNGLFVSGLGFAALIFPDSFMTGLLDFGTLILVVYLLALGVILIVAAMRFERLEAARGQLRE